VHPELFELKALVAGRLDAHRRREIDDHLGSCADCSRHYVALMLGSTSPKTAEAEARQGLVPSGAGSTLTIGGVANATIYGIDAPIAPATARPEVRPPHSNAPALETEFPAPAARTQVPVSASLVDAIAKLRAESDAPKAKSATPVAAAPVSAAPRAAESPLIEPSIFMPTPVGGVSVVTPRTTPSAPARSAELPGFMSRPVSMSPGRSHEPQPELVVTFSSTPSRVASYRSPTGTSAVSSVPASFEYVSQAVPLPAPDLQVTATKVSRKPTPMLYAIAGGAALLLILGVSGYKYFKSSVSQAAAEAAAATAKQFQAAARSAPPAPVAAPLPPAPEKTRIVYVREPTRRAPESRSSTPTPQGTPAAPAASVPVALPDVNLSTGAEGALQTNTQRSATSELTRSARATASRTAAPRP
jgi:hypothetical protein